MKKEIEEKLQFIKELCEKNAFFANMFAVPSDLEKDLKLAIGLKAEAYDAHCDLNVHKTYRLEEAALKSRKIWDIWDWNERMISIPVLPSDETMIVFSSGYYSSLETNYCNAAKILREKLIDFILSFFKIDHSSYRACLYSLFEAWKKNGTLSSLEMNSPLVANAPSAHEAIESGALKTSIKNR